MREMKRTTGGRVGYESVNVSVRRNDPSSKGVSAGRQRSQAGRWVHLGVGVMGDTLRQAPPHASRRCRYSSRIQPWPKLLGTLHENGMAEERMIGELSRHSRGPKMTAFHIMILSEFGEPLIPTGGSLASRLKSRIRRRLAAVDCEISS